VKFANIAKIALSLSQPRNRGFFAFSFFEHSEVLPEL
jgi:hypothetical protein